MGIYQLDLDLLETACKGYEESAERLRGDIEALYGTQWIDKLYANPLYQFVGRDGKIGKNSLKRA